MGIIVLLIVLSLLAIILLAPINLRIKYDSEPQISLRYLFFKYTFLPKKKQKKRMSQKDFLARLFSKGNKEKTRSASKKADSHKKKKASASGILEFIKSSSDFLKKVLSSFLKRSKIKVSEISIVVATEDSSRTAIMYGVISQAVAYLLQILDCFTTLKKSYKGTISVIPDFTKENSSIKLDIRLQCHLLNASGVILSALVYMIKNSGFIKPNSKKSRN